MNKEEIKNRIDFLRQQLPDKKNNVEKAIRELQVICDEILSLEEKLKNPNE